MDGPISASESAGSAQQAAFFRVQVPGAGHPEKVTPVSENSRSRSSGRYDAGQSRKTYSPPSSNGEPASVPSDEQRPAQAGAEDGQGPFSPPPAPSQSSPPDDFPDAVASVKESWVEVNREFLDSSKAHSPLRDEAGHDALQRQQTIRFQTLAMPLLPNPHPSRPVIDLFV